MSSQRTGFCSLWWLNCIPWCTHTMFSYPLLSWQISTSISWPLWIEQQWVCKLRHFTNRLNSFPVIKTRTDGRKTESHDGSVFNFPKEPPQCSLWWLYRFAFPKRSERFPFPTPWSIPTVFYLFTNSHSNNCGYCLLVGFLRVVMFCLILSCFIGQSHCTSLTVLELTL